jgi:hypothetical protein
MIETILLTLGADVELCLEAEWPSDDVGWDSQRDMGIFE